jgi:hypothetical protein
MAYKLLVQAIRKLPWHQYDPQMIVYLSWVTAVEFAESLRCALRAYSQNKSLNEMAIGELKTGNLSYGDYNKIGDHYEFLAHFTEKILPIKKISPRIFSAREKYWDEVRNLGDDTTRAMTIFSREQELPDIFQSILKAHDWEKERLGFFKYYLERHIELDGEDGGHADLTKGFELDESVLKKFYQSRLNMYKALEN